MSWRCYTESDILYTVDVSVQRLTTRKCSLTRTVKTYKEVLTKVRASLLAGVQLVNKDVEDNKKLLELLLWDHQ